MSTQTTVVLLDHSAEGQLRPPVLEVLTAARHSAPGAQIIGVWLGEAAPQDLALLGSYGVSEVRQITSSADLFMSAVAGEVLAEVVRQVQANLVLAVSTFTNKEITARSAVELEAGLIVDASGLQVQGDGLIIHKTVFAGTWNTQSVVTTPVQIITIKPNSISAQPAAQASEPTVVQQVIEASENALKSRLVSREVVANDGRPVLSEAQTVVCAGRGIDGDFTQVEALADALGAAIGATRVVTDEGWIGHEAQIGQTGVTIAPKLYIGAGVSGAVHHRGGMQSSGTIVAINTDANAPIFEIADFGIVGDLTELLPQITDLVKARNAQN